MKGNENTGKREKIRRKNWITVKKIEREDLHILQQSNNIDQEV